MNTVRAILVAAVFATPVAAWSQTACDPDLKATDEALMAPPRPGVTQEDIAEAKKARAEAGALAAKGDDIACVATIGAAMELLDISEPG